MALVNPNIAMSFRQPEFQPRNALAEYAQVQQIMGGQRQAEMADMQMEELRRKERAISQIQAAAVKHGGPTNRREIAQAYIKSGVPEFMKIGLTMDQDLDELEAFDRIMGGGAGGAARAAPSAAAAAPANAMAAPAAAPAGQLVAAPMPRPTGTVRDIAPGGAVGPETSIAQNLSSFRNTPPTGTKDIFGGQLSQEDKQRIEQYPGIKDLYETYSTNAAFFLNTPPDDYYYRNNVHLLAEQAKKLSDLTGVKVPGTVEGLRQVLNIGQPAAQPPATANALAPAAAPVTNAMIAPATQPAVPPAGLNQLAAAGAAPAGTAQTDPVAELRAKRYAFIRRGTARALQAARSLDADIALLSRTTSVAPGSTVIGPDGRLVYQAAAAPSSIATLEAEIAALKKAGVVESDTQVQSRRAAIQQASGQSTDLIRNYNAAVADGFKGTIFEYQRQIAAAGRAPVQPVAPTITTVEDPTKPGSFLQVDARTYRGGGAGSPGVIGGARPSATAEKTAAQRVQLGKDLDFAISELSNITKDGGLIDQSTGSGAGRLVDIGAGFVGQATKGAIAIGKIEPVADLALKLIPRFEGPQSNMDTASYKAAAGQLADPTLPTAIRKEAGKTVLRLMRERKNQFVTREMAAESAAPAAAPAGGGAAGGGVDTSNPLLR